MIEIKKLEPTEISDFRKLIAIFKEVFESEEDISEDPQLSRLLRNSDFMVFVVKLNNQVVGGLTMYVLHRYFGTKPIAYLYDVGMDSKFQRQGLGKALIAAVCAYCKEHGFEVAYVEAEMEDIDAVNFYRKTACSHEINATHFTYTFEKDKLH
jgi:aminoglycoside 3-N-acetyltransferase I